MNTIIIYSSKYGSTADCAKLLKAGLSNFVTLADIDDTSPQTMDFGKYDTIIIGSSIYVGLVSKKISAFCSEYKDLLLKKRIAIFVCCGFPEKINEYISANFFAELLEHAVVVKSFGGEARLVKMKTVDKLIMKVVTKGNYNNLTISKSEIDNFITAINDNSLN